MDVPGPVARALGEESVTTTVDLGGEDGVYITPTRTLVYRSEGLLSEASVTSYPHEAERVTVEEGRRRSRITSSMASTRTGPWRYRLLASRPFSTRS